MTSIAVFGATGNLGRHVVRQALDRGCEVSVAVRSRSKLPQYVEELARVTIADIASASTDELVEFIGGHDALICCAGTVSEGERFVTLIDKVVFAVESMEPASRPVSWFMAGAALLDLDERGRRGVDLPKVQDTYWPHRKNFDRLQSSSLNWRLLCPGPMVDQPSLGVDRHRISTETIPSPLPSIARFLPSALLLPFFAMKIPEMIISYADAASFILNNLASDTPMSRKRVAIALPSGMREKKSQWSAKQSAA